MQIIQNTTTNQTPKTDSEHAADRIKYLAVVGNALVQTASERSYLTSFYSAKDSLYEFSNLVNQLDLDAESRNGINNLIEYLGKKIDKRLKNADNPAAVA